MDLDDLLEDLLEDAAKAARRGARRVAKSTKGVRRKARRATRATAAVSAVCFLVLGAALTALGDPGAIREFFGVLMLLTGMVSGGVAVAAHVADRRDPDVQRARAARQGPVSPDLLDEDLSELPKDVRAEFRRLLQARRLVQDLGRDGWVDPPAMIEVDGQVARLHRLLVADGRTAKLGGSPSRELREQTAELADLLVALADEAVHHQADSMARERTVAVTLEDARDHLHALRAARQEVEGLDPDPDTLRRRMPGGGPSS